MSQAAPLVLTDAAHTEQKGWRRGQHLVDSLPYVDSLTPTEKAAVDKLIEEEVRSPARRPASPAQTWLPARPAASRPSSLTAACLCPTSSSTLQMRSSSKKPGDYLGELPPLPNTRFAGDPLLEQELARVAAGEGMQAMDTARYSLTPPPPTKRNDYASWRSALDNAYAQLEHQYNRWA
jgi:pre-mRNA-splicing factor SPF27